MSVPACLPRSTYTSDTGHRVGERRSLTGVVDYYEPADRNAEPTGYVLTSGPGLAKVYLSRNDSITDPSLATYRGKTVTVDGVFDDLILNSAEKVTEEHGSVPPRRKKFPVIRLDTVRVASE
jgi:hypothetical protein